VTTDDDLARVTVGDVQLLDAPVTLVEHDPAWPERYEAFARDICGALGDAVVLLEHVGSTSVPGLAAKPIIDIVLAVLDSSQEGAYVDALAAEGFVLRIREPEWYEHRMLQSQGADVHLHVFTAGCPEIDRMLLFRNALRADVAARDRYAAAKHDLAARHWRHVQHYADAKTTVVQEILTHARHTTSRA
jgi:GrpB-like predicted nucleotidyltransferase (UPF0157 family)